MQQKKGKISVLELKKGKESKLCEAELDLSGLLGKDMRSREINFTQGGIVQCVMISASLWPEAGDSKAVEDVEYYLDRHCPKDLVTKEKVSKKDEAKDITQDAY